MIYETARIAAQLARSAAGRHLTVDEIARDALSLAKAANRAKGALETKKLDACAEKVKSLAERYGAALVDRRDPLGMIFGLEFLDGSGPHGRNVFFLA